MAKRKPTPDACLTGEEIFAVDDHRLERVDVPEWNGHVFVRTLSGDERDVIEGTVQDYHKRSPSERLRGLRALLVGKAAVNEKGERLFTDGQIAQLGRKNAAPLDRIFAVAQRLAKLTDNDVDALVGNSEGGPSGASG